MKSIIYGALFGIVLTAVILSAGANTVGAPVLAYVYSNSMEPLIRVNDAFIVLPSAAFRTGDIIMYRPAALNASYITHRIIGIGETGFITRGDNSPFSDQESGEPEVSPSRIIGKVLAVNGQPLTIPRLGALSAMAGTWWGKYTKHLAAIFFGLGVISLFAGAGKITRRRKPRRRPRLRDVYRIITVIAVGTVMISVYLGSRVTQIKYLVSEYPGSLGNHVEVSQPGSLKIKIKNNGLVPVWTFPAGIPPLNVHEPPEIIRPRSSVTLLIDVEPHHKTGIYYGYVQSFNYPVLLPRAWIARMHRITPLFCILSEGIAIGLWFIVFFKALGHIHGFEGWIPLKTVKNKITNRRIKRAEAKITGRRRIT